MLRVRNTAANRIHLQGHRIDENQSSLTFHTPQWKIRLVPLTPQDGPVIEQNAYAEEILQVMADRLHEYGLTRPIVSMEIWEAMCYIDTSLNRGDLEKIRPTV